MRASELIARVEKVCGTLGTEQRAELVAAAREIGVNAVLETLDQVRVYKSWVVLWAYLDRKRTETAAYPEQERAEGGEQTLPPPRRSPSPWQGRSGRETKDGGDAE